MAAEGHIIGNHSWSHPDLTQVSDEQIKEGIIESKGRGSQTNWTNEMQYFVSPRGYIK